MPKEKTIKVEWNPITEQWELPMKQKIRTGWVRESDMEYENGTAIEVVLDKKTAKWYNAYGIRMLPCTIILNPRTKNGKRKTTK